MNSYHCEEGHIVSLSVVHCLKAKLIDEMVSMVTKYNIPVVRLLIKYFTVKRDTISVPVSH